MKTFQIAGTLVSYRSLVGNSLRITFDTQENLTPELVANIHYSREKVGFLAFAPDPFTTHELEEIDKLKVEYNDTGKPPSQRLRAVFYRLFEQDPQGYQTFNDYYSSQMEKLIIHFKDKLV